MFSSIKWRRIFWGIVIAQFVWGVTDGFAQENLPPPLDPSTAAPLMPFPRDPSVRIGDITSISGLQVNFLQGLGLVVGLQNTGAKDIATQQAILNYLRLHDLPVSVASTKNCCLVNVQADLMPLAKKGEKIFVDVGALGDAPSLNNGQLVRCELKGYDGEVYAVAQGTVLVPGFSASGQAGSVTKNHTTLGEAQGVIEREVRCDTSSSPFVNFLLRNKDSLTASRITAAINQVFPNLARTIDSGEVQVLIPQQFLNSRTEFIATISALRVIPHQPAKVVVNQRSGTIVIGGDVRISQVTFANENLIISTTETPVASQPAPFSQGTTQVLPRTQIQAFSEVGKYNVLAEGVSVGELADALNQMGIPPRDLINIFQSLKDQGALQADLEIR